MMAEINPPTGEIQSIDKYQHRLDSAKRLRGYDDLSDERKQYISQLAYDNDIDILTYNEMVNAEFGDKKPDEAIIATAANMVLGGLTEDPGEISRNIDLPQSFAEIRTKSGHSIEDIVRSMDDISIVNIESTLGSLGRLTSSDKVFYENDFLDKHLKNVAKITNGFLQHFPEKYRKEADEDTTGAYHVQNLFLQHDSPAYLKAKKVEGRTDKPTVRLYLNPELSDSTAVYVDFLNEALKSKLRFKSKIIRPADMPAYRSYKAEYLDKGIGKLDPIVIYGYEESKDELLKIIGGVYKKHEPSFKVRTSGGSSFEIADGLAVGDEVHDSGESSLTSSRVDEAKAVLSELKRVNPSWDKMSLDTRKQVFVNSLRKRFSTLGFNPDNIAFNT